MDPSTPRPRGLARRTLLAAVAAVPVGAAVGTAASAAPSRHRSGWPPTPVAATPDTALTGLFNAYSDSGVGWTGADSTYSVRLPDGRIVWIFSDTFLGPVNPDGSRPRDAPFINNSFVVQDGNDLTTVTGGTADAPTALVVPDADGTWYWAGAGMLGPDTLDVAYLGFGRNGDGPLDFAWRRNRLARFDPVSLRLLDLTDLPSAVPNLEGPSWLSRVGGDTYIYRVEDLGNDKYLHVARVAGIDLRQPWRYYTGSGWSADETASARLLRGVSNEYSVTPFGDGWILVTQDTTEVYSPHIVAYFARTPVGPFTGKTLLYTTPETGGNLWTYNPHAHPELSAGGRMVVSYNVNTMVNDELYTDVSIYRPRFVDVTFEGVRGRR